MVPAVDTTEMSVEEVATDEECFEEAEEGQDPIYAFLKYLWREERTKDMTIITSQGKVVKCHAAIFALLSKFTRTLVTNCDDNSDLVVFIPDVSKENMVRFMEHAYGVSSTEDPTLNPLCQQFGMKYVLSSLGARKGPKLQQQEKRLTSRLKKIKLKKKPGSVTFKKAFGILHQPTETKGSDQENDAKVENMDIDPDELNFSDNELSAETERLKRSAIEGDSAAEFPCDQCDKVLTTIQALKNHQKSHAHLTRDCRFCGESLKRTKERSLGKIVSDHERTCKRREARMNQPDDGKHQPSSSQQPKRSAIEGDSTAGFPCDQCTKVLTTIQALKTHKISHLARECRFCGKSLKRTKERSLSKIVSDHERMCKRREARMNQPPKEEPRCKTCNKQFKFISRLKQHGCRVSCPHCQQIFKNGQGLRHHRCPNNIRVPVQLGQALNVKLEIPRLSEKSLKLSPNNVRDPIELGQGPDVKVEIDPMLCEQSLSIASPNDLKKDPIDLGQDLNVEMEIPKAEQEITKLASGQ